MFRTDLDGAINEIKSNKMFHLALLVLACVITFLILNKYVFNNDKNNFNDVMVLYSDPNGGNCNKDIPRIDEAIIRNHINLPNRDPKLLTSSMVIPEITSNQELQKQTRMEVLNMFYNSTDDGISFDNRPRGLYLIP